MRALTFALLLAVGSAVWAQEFEIISNTDAGTATAPGAVFSASERLDGSLRVPFDLAGGGFQLKAHVNGGYPDGFGGDIDELSFTMIFKNPDPDWKSLTWILGRFAVSDATGLILNHAGDGFSATFGQSGWSFTTFAAYTGLTMRSSSGISLSRTDSSEEGNLLASPRLLGGISADFDLPAGHSLTVAALAQQDLHDRSTLVEEWSTEPEELKGGRLDTQYLTVQGDGPLAQGLFYDSFFTFGSGSTLSKVADLTAPHGFQYEYHPVVSFLTGLTVEYFLPAVMSSNYSLRVLAASGDADSQSTVEGNTEGWATGFIPVTGASLGVVFNPGLTNLIVYELGASLKPLPSLPLTTGAKVLGFQRAVAGQVNAGGVLRTGPTWMGQEVDFNVMWKPLSDVSVSASVGAFIPTAGTFAAGSPGAGFQSALKVGATLSL